MKKKTKNLISVALILMVALMVLFAGCGSDKLSDKVSIAVLNGPTGMGLVELSGEDSIALTTYQAPNDVVSKLLAGEADIAAVPSNLAAVLDQKTKGNITALSNIAYGVLYIVGNNAEIDNIKDLEGKTVLASGKGGTPEYVLSILLKENGVNANVEWMANHSDVAQKVATEKGTIALLPEPFVSVAASKNKEVRQVLDLNAIWSEYTGTGLPMGTLITTKKFLEERGDDVRLILELAKQSAEDVNGASDEILSRIVEEGYLASPEAAKKAIPGCSICCTDPETTKKDLSNFYGQLYQFDKKSVGGELPDDDFYYSE